MPITQDRLISLLETIDHLLEQSQTLKNQTQAIKQQIFLNRENPNELFTLAVDIANLPDTYLILPIPMLENYHLERAHFKVMAKRNERSKVYAKKLRNREKEREFWETTREEKEG